MIKIYLASGWFNEQQMSIMKEIKEVLDVFKSQGTVDYFAPYWNGIVLKPGDPKEKWKETWNLDIDMIKDSQLMIANIEGFEPGTIYECGYAGACGIPVIYYSNVVGRGLNLMLSFSAYGFANTKEQLTKGIYHFFDKPRTKFNVWEGEPI